MQQIEAYLSQQSLQQAKQHAATAANNGLEAMGLLAGQVREWQGEKYVIVDQYITGGNASTSVSVKFSDAAFPKLAAQVNASRRKGGILVGWCHSHPNYGCFLSSMDVATQKKYFAEDFNIAVVLDPVRNEKQVFKLAQGPSAYRKASYAVIQKR